MRANPCKIIPTSESTSEMWITWHKTLKKWFSKQEANMHWIRFWQQRAGAGSGADTHALRTYMKKQGVDLTTDVWGELTDTGAGVVDWFADTINMTRVIVVGIVVVGVGLVAFYVINSSRKGKSVGEMALDVRSLGAKSKATKLLGKLK